jgi:4-amino-4-deoxy-L-arabinose transferase-like glycosyltransferase
MAVLALADRTAQISTSVHWVHVNNVVGLEVHALRTADVTVRHQHLPHRLNPLSLMVVRSSVLQCVVSTIWSLAQCRATLVLLQLGVQSVSVVKRHQLVVPMIAMLCVLLTACLLVVYRAMKAWKVNGVLVVIAIRAHQFLVIITHFRLCHLSTMGHRFRQVVQVLVDLDVVPVCVCSVHVSLLAWEKEVVHSDVTSIACGVMLVTNFSFRSLRQLYHISSTV